MAVHEDRSRFIPYRKAEVVELLCADGVLKGDDIPKFKSLVKMIESLYHFQFHAKLENLKDLYFPFNPDSDVRTQRTYSPAQLSENSRALVASLTDVLNDANYERVPKAAIEEALEGVSLFNIKMFIDFDEYEECLIFARGEVTKRQSVKRMLFFKRELDVPTYERVALFVRFKGRDHFTPKRLKQMKFEPGSTIVKLFKDIPKADLEMLFPNTEVRMKGKDKLMMGVPGVGGGVPVLIKVGASISPLFAVVFAALSGKNLGDENIVKAAIQGAVAVILLGGYLFRQWTAYKNKRIYFLKALTDNLYFKNLDNNAGVFNHLIDSAEEEECKEAILGYYFLATRGAATETAVDDAIEEWFETKHGVKIDFEVDDALGKLADLGLGREENGTWQVLPLDQACERVDYIWDNFFQFNGAGAKDAAPA